MSVAQVEQPKKRRRAALGPHTRQHRLLEGIDWRSREAEAARDPRPAMATIEGCTVEQIAYAEAKALITRYEWLRTMPTVTRACYGLRAPSGEVVGVVVFAVGPAPEAG